MSKLIELLIDGNEKKISDYLKDEELRFYTEDTKDIVIQMDFTIPNYDTLMKVLGIGDGEQPILSDMNSSKGFVNKIDAFKTKVTSLYFFRMEQYGLADEDAVISQLVFTQDLDKVFDSCIEFLSKSDIVSEAKRYYKEQGIKI